MTEFFRFPQTPHITWLSEGMPRDDKLLSPADLEEFLSHELIVEEKIDGANLGFSISPEGKLQAQNRGSFIDLDDPYGQWKPIRWWLSTVRYALKDALGPNLMLFGEWCYARHTVNYTRLPSYFVAFDVYDREAGAFWSVARRNAFAAELGIMVVPERARGQFDLDGLIALLGESVLTEGPAEGIYVRQEDGDWLKQRAKLVRAEFVQAIEEHWSKRGIEENQLADGFEMWRQG